MKLARKGWPTGSRQRAFPTRCTEDAQAIAQGQDDGYLR